MRYASQLPQLTRGITKMPDRVHIEIIAIHVKSGAVCHWSDCTNIPSFAVYTGEYGSWHGYTADYYTCTNYFCADEFWANYFWADYF